MDGGKCSESGQNVQPSEYPADALFVEFEIIGSSAGWMRAENTLIQTAEIRFLFTLYQSIFGPLFRYMLPINSNIPQKRKSLLLSCSIRRRFSVQTFLTFSFGTLRTSFSISRSPMAFVSGEA